METVATTWDGLPVSKEMPFGASVAVWRDRDGRREWLVLHRAHHGPDYAGEWAWTPPSGARFPSEPVDECARRELREETGLELACMPTGERVDWAIYVAEAPADAQVVLDAEHDRYEWLSLEEAIERCLPEPVAATLAAADAAISGR